MKKLNFSKVQTYYSENKSILIPIIIAVSLIVLLIIVYIKSKNRPVNFAKRFIGQEETGGNKGFLNSYFENLMEKAGWKPGNQWCAFFTKMVWMNTLKPKHRKAAQKIMTGSTQLNLARFEKYGKGFFKISDKPKKNALVIWQSLSDKSRGHTGIVTKVNNLTKDYKTIEGNSNKGGSPGIVAEHSYSKNGSPKGMKFKAFIIPV